MPEPFDTIQQAIIAKLALEGVTCYDHQPASLYGTPSAYLVVTDAPPDYRRSDQGEIAIGSVSYSLRYYVDFSDGEQVAYAVAYTGIRKLYAGLSSGTLGGSVRACEIQRVDVDPVEFGANQRPMLLVEFSLVVRPAQYV